MRAAKHSLFFVLIVYPIITMQLSCATSPGTAATPISAKAFLPPAAPIVVRIENFSFQPRDLEIAVGDTVTWRNFDDVPHTATNKDDPQAFDSGALDTDDQFSFTFSKPGIYAYYCKVHPHMTGVVTVK